MRNFLYLFRKILIILLALWIYMGMGIWGFIDLFQPLVVFVGAILLALLWRKFNIRGLAYIMEYTGIIAGFAGTLYQTFTIYTNYGDRFFALLPFCALSLFYGICFSTLNGALIKKRKSTQGRRSSR